MRDWHDRRLHPHRSSEAAERLRRLAPRSVLILCLGNVCRSPYAARRLADRLEGISVDSAGFIGPGRSPPEIAVAVARARNVDHADHRSRIVTAGLLEEADAVFIFDGSNAARLRSAPLDPERLFWLGDFDPTWSGKRAIIDPWGQDRENFERTFDRIDRCVQQVAHILQRPTDSRSF